MAKIGPGGYENSYPDQAGTGDLRAGHPAAMYLGVSAQRRMPAACRVLGFDVVEPYAPAADPAVMVACLAASARWFAPQAMPPPTLGERTYHQAVPGTRKCTGVRRGYVGVVPDDARPARDLTEVYRALKLVLAACGRRADRRAHLEEAARFYLARTDHGTLLARPGHDHVLDNTGMSLRTLQRCLDDLHDLGMLITIEEGTTPRLRKARCKPGQTDPYEHQDNRAEVYRWCLPLWAAHQLDAAFPPKTAGQTPEKLSGTPSRFSPKERAGSATSCRRQPAGSYARARIQRSAPGAERPQAAGKDTNPPRPRRTPSGPPPWLARRDQVSAVWQAMPAELTARLADHEAQRLANEIARQLEHRTTAELADRITRHWSWWRFKLAADLVRSPVAIAHRMLRRDFDDCPDVRCEDQWQLDLQQPCKACAAIAQAKTKNISEEGGGQALSATLSAPPALSTTRPQAGSRPLTTTLTAPPAPALPHERATAHANAARALLLKTSPGARKIINRTRRETS